MANLNKYNIYSAISSSEMKKAYMNLRLETAFPDNPEIIDKILANAKTYVLNNMENYRLEPPFPDDYYDVTNILKDYGDKCLELADKKSS